MDRPYILQKFTVNDIKTTFNTLLFTIRQKFFYKVNKVKNRNFAKIDQEKAFKIIVKVYFYKNKVQIIFVTLILTCDTYLGLVIKLR